MFGLLLGLILLAVRKQAGQMLHRQLLPFVQLAGMHAQYRAALTCRFASKTLSPPLLSSWVAVD